MPSSLGEMNKKLEAARQASMKRQPRDKGKVPPNKITTTQSSVGKGEGTTIAVKPKSRLRQPRFMQSTASSRQRQKPSLSADDKKKKSKPGDSSPTKPSIIATIHTMNTAIAESPALLEHKEIWVQEILPFVGVGHYAFVGRVNKKLNQLYKEYCDIELERNPQEVYIRPMDRVRQLDFSRFVKSTDTLHSATFCSVSRAEFWINDRARKKRPEYHDVCGTIAQDGNIAVMRWARKKGFPWDVDACASAARNGHLDLLIWLKKRRCPWDKWTCQRAAQQGHWEVVKWARARGCPLDSMICLYAAQQGNLEILKWAHANGCPLSTLTFIYASDRCQRDMIQWLRDNGCPGSHDEEH